MDHKNIRNFKLCAFVNDNSPNAIAAILTMDTGDQFMITASLSIAGEISLRFREALQQATKEGAHIQVPRSPERVLRYDATREAGDEPAVHLFLEGDRSREAFLGALTLTDARRLGAKLMAEAESAGPKRAN